MTPDDRDITWDATVRWFHWINVLCVIFMAGTGTIILNSDAFGIAGEGKVFLKEVHAYGGYVLAVNLLWRIIWAFIGSRTSRWRALLPGGRGFAGDLRQQISDLRMGNFTVYPGHSPIGRIAISLLLLLLIVQAGTGLVLAGTDVYLPPFGSFFANWVTEGDPALLASLQPGSTEFVVDEAYEAMRAFRKPIVGTHEYVFFTLLFFIALHIIANVVGEVRAATGQISAMFSGRKVAKD